jgi:type I restriction enzyme S subunit
MQSNYKPIGDYIQLADERNKGLKVTSLLGLSISKQFIKSVANTIGTDMENYKIIRKNQFACSTMQVRRDKKMPVALYIEDEPSIISQAYPIFEIINTKKLLPEYLMMWFTRSEFDREACFHAVGGVRGSLEWEDFCGMKLPIPSPEKQQEIVHEYNVIKKRIDLNNQLITKLEETAQAIYEEFVDSKVSNNLETLADYIESTSTGLDAIKRAPIVNENTGVKCLRIQDVSKEANWNNWGFTNVEKSNFIKFQLKKDDIIVARTGATVGGNIFINKDLNAVFNNGLIRIRADRSKVHPIILKQFFKTQSFVDHINSIAFGTSTQPNIQIGNLLSFQISFPTIKVQKSLIEHLIKISNLSFGLNEQKYLLEELKELLLAKMTKVKTETHILN